MTYRLSLVDTVRRVLETVGPVANTERSREQFAAAVSEEISRWYQESTGQTLPITIAPEISDSNIRSQGSITDVMIYSDKVFLTSSHEASNEKADVSEEDGAVVRWWLRSPGFSPTVVFDFDGVIHSYTSGWQGSDAAIPDPPVPGIKEAIDHIRDAGYRVVVVSTRCRSFGGQYAISKWLRENRIEVDNISAEKPPAVCYIDDRALTFDGHPETLLERIVNFRPWYQFKKE